jgi:hypothetical protein
MYSFSCYERRDRTVCSAGRQTLHSESVSGSPTGAAADAKEAVADTGDAADDTKETADDANRLPPI